MKMLREIARDLAARPQPVAPPIRSRKDARAEKLIREFAAKLIKLGRGQVPEAWKRMTQEALGVSTLSRFYKDMTPPETARPRGRPPTLSAANKTRLLRIVDVIKSDLSFSTDAAALRHWLKMRNPLLSDLKQREAAKVLAKVLSRAKPLISRRIKKQSHKSPRKRSK